MLTSARKQIRAFICTETKWCKKMVISVLKLVSREREGGGWWRSGTIKSRALEAALKAPLKTAYEFLSGLMITD